MARPATRPLGPLFEGVSFPTAALALVAAGVQVAGSFGASQGQPERTSLDAVAVTLLLVGPLALVWRRHRPVAVLGVVVTATLLYLISDYPFGPVILSPIVAIYTAVASGHRVAGWAGTAALYGVHMAYRTATDDTPSALELLAVGAWLLLILAGSEVVRAYQDRAAETALAQQEERRRRAGEERLSIARELHDVLAHHISLMNVQASVALHLMDRKPEQARTALVAIEDASREAMAELRSVLDILHRADDAAPRRPTPGLDQLDALVERAELAGLAVNVRIEGERRPLRLPVEAAAYRVIQEAVTNVIRHASATTASVLLTYALDRLTVTVEDDGTGLSDQAASKPKHGREDRTGGGSGIPGMAERVRALGGEFEAGARTGRGFGVRASIPLGDEP